MQNIFYRNIVAGLVLMVGPLSTAPASAVIREAVYTGRISSGSDQTGFFRVGASLTNTPYSLRFRYDTTLGTTRSGLEYTELSGGPYQGWGQPMYWGRPTPILFADLTINDITKRISGNWTGRIFAGTDNSLGSPQYIVGHIAYQNDYSSDVTIDSTYQIYVSTDPATRNLETIQQEIAVSVPWWGNTLWIRETHASAPANNIDIYALMEGSATLQITNPVPEPASWTMLIIGFGVTGAALRYRRATAVIV